MDSAMWLLWRAVERKVMSRHESRTWFPMQFAVFLVMLAMSGLFVAAIVFFAGLLGGS